MMTPLDALAGLWLLAWPNLGAVSTPPSIAADPVGVSAPMRTAESPASLLELTEEALLARIEADPASLGSISIGRPGSATLVNAVSLESGPSLEVARNAEPWGTSETLAAVQFAIDTVHELFPDTPPIMIGDISSRNGGRLKRHQTHQGGRDVDFGFYYKAGKNSWFAPGTAANLDLARNWALVRALVTRTDVETILLDTRIQRALYRYALGLGEDKDWLDRVFQFARGYSQAIVRHVAGHRTHYHVRFYNAVAQELGRRAYPLFVQLKLVPPPVYTVSHLVRSGQTVGYLAARYGTSARSIMQANGLRTSRLRAGRTYRIPVRGAAAPAAAPFVVPHRLLPPNTPSLLAAVDWPTSDSLYGTTAER